MPELPEVETAKRGISPFVEQQTVANVIIRQRQLRWPITKGFAKALTSQQINQISRRGKYLLFHTDAGSLIMHLGMSGHVSIVDAKQPAQKHDHVDIVMQSGKALRFTDPRRFGCLLWTQQDPYQHRLLATLGPEPLSNAFDTATLYLPSRKRRIAIKKFIMNSHIVVGVGNIYANEALHRAGIRPSRACQRVTRREYGNLVTQIQTVLQLAIKQGGTSLRDFVNSDGKPGYFKQQLQVYGRSGQQCLSCASTLKLQQIDQRQTVYCPQCQR